MTEIRSFVAVDIPAGMRDDIARIQREIATEGLRLVRPELVHVTLKFLGNVPEEQIERIAETLRSIRSAPFDASLKGMGSFPGRSIRVVWLGLEGNFPALYQAVENALAPFGFERDKRGFSPHVTLGRVKSPSTEVSKQISRKISQIGDVDLGSFPVDHFLLKKSTITSGGPIYEDLAEFSLTDH
ncbi:MAG: RNA 2',3'-cyclic phosphodiesterase [Methanotrichaceae archaeon]